MRSNIISFRFDDTELEALQTFQIPEDKSPNQTAARLLRGMLAGIIEQSTASSTPVDIEEFKQQVEASLTEVRSQLEASFSEVRSQLEELRGKSKAR
ncbi:MAG: hypothetical protein V7K67_02320 [Nostoc sp.]|uniref:hypothetical protein n=1 Tax=Nostoc sp. TaxID=1180 RepID=UPI002FF56CFB